jgi:hypothetical protein
LPDFKYARYFALLPMRPSRTHGRLPYGNHRSGITVSAQQRNTIFDGHILLVVGRFLYNEQRTSYRRFEFTRFFFTRVHRANYFVGPLRLAIVNMFEDVIEGLILEPLFRPKRRDDGSSSPRLCAE